MRIDQLTPSELSLFRDHLIGLPSSDRYLRFGSTMCDSAISAYVDAVTSRNEPVLAIWVNDVVVACVHVAIADGTAEFGISVDPNYRGQGYGRLLFVYAHQWCKRNGVQRIVTHCLAQNKWMMELARREGMHLERDGCEVLADKMLRTAA